MSIAENQVISNQLQNTVVGKTIVKVIANQNPHTYVWFATEPCYAFASVDISHKQAEQYEKLLTGKVVEASEVHFGSYSTYNFLYIGDRALMFNIPTRYYAPDEKPPKRHQLYLTFEDGSSLSLCGSLGGTIYLFRVDQNGLAVDYPPPDTPSMLSDEFSEVFFLNLIKNTDLTRLKPAKTVKCFLATNNRIPGLDNSILHEILWEARVNPKSDMAALGETEYKRIFAVIKKIIPEVIAAGGLDTGKNIFGKPGFYVTKASRNTLDKPCEHCGEHIIKESHLGGVVYYCPRCQPIVKK